jgi:predicted metal-dependent phosphoesterase TrpH
VNPDHPATERFADLHLHTRFSDGTFTPEQVADRAHAEHLAAISLTDHDTVEGCERMRAACQDRAIEFIPGTELTAEAGSHEVHILGYLIDTSADELLQTLANFQAVRRNRIVEIVERLNAVGVPLTVEQVMTLADCRAPGRPHVARALVRQGHCSAYDEAFERYLKKGRPGWAPKSKMAAHEAIDLIHDAGGVAVLAHPALYRADELIPELAEAGIDGIECWHTKHTAATSDHYARMAVNLNLLATGGSDCHGDSKGAPLIGTMRLPYERIIALKERRASRVSNQRPAEPELR